MRILVTSILFLLAAACPALAGDARFRMPDGPAYEGVPFAILVEVADAANIVPPTVPEIEGATVSVSERGRQSFTEIRNGRIKNSLTVTYAVEVVPERPGTLRVPAIEVTVDGTVLRSRPQDVTVLPSDAGDLLGAEVFGQPPEVYIGQPLELVLRISVKPYRDRVHGVLGESDMWRLIDLQNSEWGIFEPAVVEMRQRNQAPRAQQESRDGEVHYVYELTRRTWPPKTGTPDIGAVRIRMVYPLALRTVQNFFNDPQLTISESRPLSVTASVPAITVLPLPEQGRPPSFTGAVGKYAIAVTAKPVTAAVGDPITLTLAITDVAGGANLESLQAPALAADPLVAKDFKVPNEPLSGITGGNTKRFAVTVRPLRTGIEAVPPIEFSYFDPESRAYGVARSAPVPITVTPANQVDLSKIVSAPGGAAPEQAAPTQLTEVAGGLVANRPVTRAILADERLQLRGTGVAAIALPPAAAAAALAWRIRRARHERDGGLARRSAARRTAAARLASAADAAAMAGAITGFVEDATDRPGGTLTRGDLEAVLRNAGVDEVLRQRTVGFLSRCDRARYAGAAGAPIAELAVEARSILDGLAAAGIRAGGATR